MGKASRRPARAGRQAAGGGPINAGSGAQTPSSGARRSTAGAASAATDTSRRGRRERSRAAVAPPPSFFARHRIAVAIVVVVLLGGVVIAGYTLASSNAQASSYTCGSQLTPAPRVAPSASASPSLGQPAPDQGRIHIPVSSTPQFYASCPPASGPHYAQPDAPLPGGFYGPDQNYGPQYWIHNLEHGEMAILYRCDSGTCDQSAQQALRSYLASPPNSPICAIPNWMVAVRFDQMPAPFAAVTWDHVLFQQKLDTGQITQFFDQAADRGPEAQCAGAPGTQSPEPSSGVNGSAGSSPSTGASASGSPSASASTAP